MQTARRVRGVAGFDQRGPAPDPRWQAALNRIAPRTRYGHDWLMVRWWAGDPWAPVQRWCVYQMTPWWRIPDFGVLEALRGPHPRTFGHYSTLEQRFVREKVVPINREQWDIFQETECWAQPLWIVQGRNGGHMRAWTEVQSTISQMHGGPAQPPVPGSLPYAPFDRRVVANIESMDLVHRFGDVLKNFADRPYLAEWLDRREKEQVTAMAGQLWDWLGTQIEETLRPGEGDGLTRANYAEMWDNADPDGEEPEYEQFEQDFIDQTVHSYGGN